jgi:hypothetical protein
LNEPGYERSVAGIVCLSTPFIHARPRTSGATFEITLALPALLLTVVTWIGLGTLQQDYWVYLLLGGLGAAFLLWVAICLFWRFGPEDEVLYRQAENEGGATKGLDWRSYRLHTDPELRAVADTATRMLGSVRLPQSKRLQPLIVRVAGDEASGALAVARFGAWLGSLALPAVRGGSKVAAGLAGLVLIVVASLSFESAWSRYPSESRVPFPISASLFALLVTPIAVAVYSVAFLVATGLLALPTFTSALPMLAYGIDLGPLLTRFEFSVEETPKGRHIVEQLSFVDARLSHCGAYDHDALPETIREWLQRRPRSEEDSDSETTGNSARPANDQRLRV